MCFLSPLHVVCYYSVARLRSEEWERCLLKLLLLLCVCSACSLAVHERSIESLHCKEGLLLLCIRAVHFLAGLLRCMMRWGSIEMWLLLPHR